MYSLKDIFKLSLELAIFVIGIVCQWAGAHHYANIWQTNKTKYESIELPMSMQVAANAKLVISQECVPSFAKENWK